MELTSDDQANISRVLDDYVRLWMEGNAQACADLYDDAGDLLAVDGTLLRDRQEIKRYYDNVMSGKYAGFTVENIRTIGIRPLGPGLALFDASWEIHGSPEEGSAATLVANVNCCLLLTQRRNEWKISAARLMVPMASSE